MDPAGVTTGTTAYSANSTRCSPGASTVNGADLLRVLTELSRQLDRLSSGNSGFSPAASPSSALWAVPVFRGFQDDVFLWIDTINSLGTLLAWPDNQKWIVAIDRLRDAAKAWHAYEGIKQRSWAEWCAKLTSLFRPLSHACDPLPADRVSTEDGSYEAHNLDGAARTPTPLPSLGDRDREGHGAAVPVVNNVPVLGHGAHLGRHVDGSSVLSSPTTDYNTTLKPEQLARPPPSSTALGHMEALAPVVPDEPRIHEPHKSANDCTSTAYAYPLHKVGLSSDANKIGPDHSEPYVQTPQLLDERVDAHNFLNDVSLEEIEVPIPVEGTVIDDLSGQTNSPAGNTAFERDSSKARGTSRPASSTTSESSTTATMLQDHELRRSSSREITHSLTQKPRCTPRWSSTNHEAGKRLQITRHSTLRQFADLASSAITHVLLFSERRRDKAQHFGLALRPCRNSQGRPPEPSLKNFHAKYNHDQELRLQRSRQLRPPVGNEAGFQGKSQRGRGRPPRHSQCRPPEPLSAKNNAKPKRPQRQSQHRPPETVLAALHAVSPRGRDRPLRGSQCRPPEASVLPMMVQRPEALNVFTS